MISKLWLITHFQFKWVVYGNSLVLPMLYSNHSVILLVDRCSFGILLQYFCPFWTVIKIVDYVHCCHSLWSLSDVSVPFYRFLFYLPMVRFTSYAQLFLLEGKWCFISWLPVINSALFISYVMFSRIKIAGYRTTLHYYCFNPFSYSVCQTCEMNILL